MTALLLAVAVLGGLSLSGCGRGTGTGHEGRGGTPRATPIALNGQLYCDSREAAALLQKTGAVSCLESLVDLPPQPLVTRVDASKVPAGMDEVCYGAQGESTTCYTRPTPAPHPPPTPTMHPLPCATYEAASLRLYARSEALLERSVNETGHAALVDLDEATDFASGAAAMREAYDRCRRSARGHA